LPHFLFAGQVHAANILTNPGFETSDFTGWTTFGANNLVQSGGSPHGGADYYKVYGQFSGASNYNRYLSGHSLDSRGGIHG